MPLRHNPAAGSRATRREWNFARKTPALLGVHAKVAPGTETASKSDAALRAGHFLQGGGTPTPAEHPPRPGRTHSGGKSLQKMRLLNRGIRLEDARSSRYGVVNGEPAAEPKVRPHYRSDRRARSHGVPRRPRRPAAAAHARRCGRERQLFLPVREGQGATAGDSGCGADTAPRGRPTPRPPPQRAEPHVGLVEPTWGKWARPGNAPGGRVAGSLDDRNGTAPHLKGEGATALPEEWR